MRVVFFTHTIRSPYMQESIKLRKLCLLIDLKTNTEQAAGNGDSSVFFFWCSFCLSVYISLSLCLSSTTAVFGTVSTLSISALRYATVTPTYFTCLMR